MADSSQPGGHSGQPGGHSGQPGGHSGQPGGHSHQGKSSSSKAGGGSGRAGDRPRERKALTSDDNHHVFLPALRKVMDGTAEIIIQDADKAALVAGLTNVHRNLKKEAYYGSSPWTLLGDVWRVFEHTWSRDEKSSSIHKYVSKMAPVFEEDVTPVMRSLGFCCGRSYRYCPRLLRCHGTRFCSVARGASYFTYLNSIVRPSALGPPYQVFNFCEECFTGAHGEKLRVCNHYAQPEVGSFEAQWEDFRLCTHPAQPEAGSFTIRKDRFKAMINNIHVPEEFIDCRQCGRAWHQVCAMYYEPLALDGFTCHRCMRRLGQTRKESKLSAKRLPTTQLGRILENRANVITKEHGRSEKVVVRVVSSYDAGVSVKPLMRRWFGTRLPSTFPYRSKSVFAFMEVQGADVCLFGMRVQEYGSTCPAPNTRRVYVNCLDAFKSLERVLGRVGAQVRQEMLVSYLQCAKLRGYTAAHVWACPPTQISDCISECHPDLQNIPTPSMVRAGYIKALMQAVADDVAVDYTNAWQGSEDGKLSSALDVPYFEGDFWPLEIEDSIAALEAAEEGQSAVDTAGRSDGGEGGDVRVVNPRDSGRPGKTVESSNKSRKREVGKSGKSRGEMSRRLASKLRSSVKKHGCDFFTVRLHSQRSAGTLGPVTDPDPVLSSERADAWERYCNTVQRKYRDFATLRRAKLSTLVFLHVLHVGKGARQSAQAEPTAGQQRLPPPSGHRQQLQLKQQLQLQQPQQRRLLQHQQNYLDVDRGGAMDDVTDGGHAVDDDDDHHHGGEDSAGGAAAAWRKRIEVNKWHGVTQWSWSIQVDLCAICKILIVEPCVECLAEQSLKLDLECKVAWGECNHGFHFHCISRWLRARAVCPLDNREWNYKKIGL